MMRRKGLTTYWFCQNVDIIETDKDNKIIYIYKKFKADKILLPRRKVLYIYLTPVGVSDSFKVGDEFIVKEKE